MARPPRTTSDAVAADHVSASTGGRFLGVVPRTPVGRALWAFGLLNLFLTFLPAWDLAFNDAQLVGGFLPMTILWSYAVFGLNMVLAIAVYVLQFRPWADEVEHSDLTRPTDHVRRDDYDAVTSRRVPGASQKERS
ncbi:MAG: hypothetical protein ACRDU8_10380 [Egibacteraceae bacterium]